MANASRSPATVTVQIDSGRVRVTRYDFAEGAETGWHRHAHDYVVVPLCDGALLLEEPDGNRTVQLKSGASYARNAGVEHNVVNATSGPFAFVEIELL
ncbi:MAG TPA: cupin domain-containing protein [Burkholderiaceae bacterium]|jgi:beta-alanine degradation protein BauB|nr:cupin domain-containing protein [Burkholderiaceae bacterium]